MVTKETVPKIRLVPMLMRIAIPMVIMNRTGSNQELVVIRRIRRMIGMMILTDASFASFSASMNRLFRCMSL